MIAMVKTWAFHGLVATGINVVCLMSGLDPIGGAATYVGHEVAQHQINGTKGVMGWVDRIGDSGIPVLISFVMFRIWG